MDSHPVLSLTREDATRQLRNAFGLLTLVAVPLWSCGSWQRVGAPERQPTPAARTLPALTDPTAIYRSMGLLTDVSGGYGFVGTVRVFAGPSQDSMLVLLALSLPNRGLAFRRDGGTFVAEYRVELALRQQAGVMTQAAREERIRVSTFRETQRTDESVIFQHALHVPAGQYVMAVVVRDRNGPAVGRAEQQLGVPEPRTPMVSMPLAVYEVQPRAGYRDPLVMVPNPRGATDYGGDTLRFYLETYGMPTGTPLDVQAVDVEGRVEWSDTARVAAGVEVQGLVVTIPPGLLGLGRHDLRIVLGRDVLAAAPFVVSFSDQWLVGNFEDMVSLLRYFAAADTLRAVINGTPEQRAAAWRHMYAASDPNAASPENEALDEYFERLRIANDRFRDEGTEGWLTDRGEVYIGLGEPTEMIDRRPDIQGRGRVLVWNYNDHRLTLYFVDETGFGRLRLDPRSRSEFLRVLSRLRRA